MIHIFAHGDDELVISNGRKDEVERLIIHMDDAPILAEMLMGITQHAEKLILDDPCDETWLDA